MYGFVLRRAVQAAVAILGVSTLVFFVQRLTGDPTLLLLPDTATQEDIEAMRHTLGLDRSLIVQYASYMWDILHLDFGRSYTQLVPVVDVIGPRIPYTLALTACALAIALGIGVPVGIVLALYQGKTATRLLMGIVIAAQSMPTFWSGILFILIFAVTLGWLPPSGAAGFESIILPSIALGLLSMATFARVSRMAVIDELSKHYIRTAKAKGVSTLRLVTHHLLRNASIPVITVAALEISNLLAGAVIVETVFAWPGLGLLTVQAIVARDFMVVQSVVLLAAFTTVSLSFFADLLYAAVDPRIRLEQSG
jgi:peptide/nickel transport system permease protein